MFPALTVPETYAVFFAARRSVLSERPRAQPWAFNFFVGGIFAMLEQEPDLGPKSRGIWPMAMQREVSPIPPGRYWILILGRANMADFDNWLRDMHGAVRIETTSLDQSQQAEFVIFNVPEGRAPFLNSDQFGFPDFAGPEITSVQDVTQQPDPVPDPLDRLPDPIDAAKQAAERAALLFAVVLIILALKR